MCKKINWEERKVDWTDDENYPIGILDVTDFFVFADWQKWNLWSFKHRTTVLKYEIVLHMRKNLIIWCSGPWTGRSSDQGIFNQQLKNVLKENEKIVSDSGYNGPHFIRPLSTKKRKLDEDEKYHNWDIHSTSAKLENLNNLFKFFGCMRNYWRHGIQKHKLAFYVILNIVQIKMQQQPLRKKSK